MKPVFRQKIGYAIIKNYYMIARNRTQFSNEDLDIENENSPNNDILGQPITTNEIHEQISKLKLKKTSGMDCILNEMIKHGRYYLMPSLEKLFNNILDSGTFPTHWNIGVIKPIYKGKGDKRSPANYRGITFIWRVV